MIVSWLLFPLLLGGLAVGFGLLVERLAGVRLPGALLAGTGMAAVVVVGGLAALTPATAGLAAPLAAALAIAGFVLAGRARLRGIDPWAVACAVAILAVYAAPIVASGAATFAGYVRLDDTATWLAITDRIAERGVSLAGLPPSTYEATLSFNLGEGYPIGAFVPLAIGGSLLGGDPAWLIQPYMAVWAAVLGLALWSLVSPLVADRRLRAAVAFVAAQPALLFGYYLWGGVKEVAAAALIATAAALVAVAVREGFRARGLIPVAIVSAALVAVLSPAGAVWLLPLLAILGVAGARAIGAAALARAAAGPAALGTLLCAPWAVRGVFPPTSAPLTDAGARGNLLGPLDPAQLAGIWPAGDFRLEPDERAITAVLVGLAAAAACAGAVVAWRRRAWPLVAFAAAALVGAGAMLALGSPWVAAKALATASPAVPVLAMVAAATLVARGRARTGLALGVLIAAGILWSNALAYRDANLAPRDQLAELEAIGEQIAGQGPTLVTEYQPYAVRHFLRDAEPEGASELRRRAVPLRGGGALAKGEWTDTDRLDLDGLIAYRTLVLRRNPSQSRPPSAYELVRAGEHYDVWQRREGTMSEIVARLPLGDGADPAAVPPCDRVRALAERSGENGSLLAAPSREVLVAELSPGEYPGEWVDPDEPEAPKPETAGEIRLAIDIERPGLYEVWLGGSVRGRAELRVAERSAVAVRHQLNSDGQYVGLGTIRLDRGTHELAIRFDGPGLAPGSGGAPDPVGPLVLAEEGSRSAGLVRVDPDDAATLCGQRWDWIEAVSSGSPAPDREPSDGGGLLLTRAGERDRLGRR